jgi:prepilin-type N-terminal cleavage/methylation domain-containing protein
MSTRPPAYRRSGFTLIEVLVVAAVIGIILVLAAPSFRDLIEMRRLRGTHAQVVTDVQFARSEAVSRQQRVVMRIGVRSASPAGTCYVIYTCNRTNVDQCTCQCGNGAGNACSPSGPDWAEIRTVEVPTSTGLTVTPQFDNSTVPELRIGFDPRSGGNVYYVDESGVTNNSSNSTGNVDTSLTRLTRTLRTKVNLSGRPSECSPSSARVTDTLECGS